MIRFLDLTEQICDTENLTEKEWDECFEFSWYSTITSQILLFDGESVWSSWEDFEIDFMIDGSFKNIERFKNLFVDKKKIQGE